jgi:hypothetical protein
MVKNPALVYFSCSGKLPHSGLVQYNGQTKEEAAGNGLRIEKICAYVDQVNFSELESDTVNHLHDVFCYT